VDDIPEKPTVFVSSGRQEKSTSADTIKKEKKDTIIEGRIWIVLHDNIDTDMIYHNRHLAVTDLKEMGKYTFGNLKGWEDYPQRSEPGDIIITGKNFGSGSSRQQAVDCFRSLNNLAILAESFGAIYERNAINAGFPVLTYTDLEDLDLKDRDTVTIDLEKGTMTNRKNNKTMSIGKFSEVQMKIYQKGDLLLL
jgi:3-isopropylmalate dehydratase small subunit